MILVAFGVLGLIVGSFLNVVILRFGVRSLGGRSACPHCGKQIVWYDNIPLISWILLSGRCRHCKESISIQYPLVEFSTGVLFAFVGAAPAPFFLQLLALPILALLIAITVYDFYHTIIPDLWVYSFDALALIYGAIYMVDLVGRPWTSGELGILILADPLVALPLFLFWSLSHGRAMGLGDSKLALGVGWLLGISNGFVALFLSFIAGGAFGAILLLLSSRWGKSLTGGNTGYTMKSEIPFGPFLIAACLFVWLSHLYGLSIVLFPWQN